jgi:hypothetical protein
MVNKVLFSGLLLFLLLITETTGAQNPSDIFSRLQTATPGQGTIQIRQDNEIRDMLNLHLAQQKKINGIYGYKISIFRGSGQQTRKDAELTRSKFLSKYESVHCELQFEYPNWKVYVGTFRTKSEALQFREKISNDYPDAFIREDIVAFPD